MKNTWKMPLVLAVATGICGCVIVPDYYDRPGTATHYDSYYWGWPMYATPYSFYRTCGGMWTPNGACFNARLRPRESVPGDSPDVGPVAATGSGSIRDDTYVLWRDGRHRAYDNPDAASGPTVARDWRAGRSSGAGPPARRTEPVRRRPENAPARRKSPPREPRARASDTSRPTPAPVQRSNTSGPRETPQPRRQEQR